MMKIYFKFISALNSNRGSTDSYKLHRQQLSGSSVVAKCIVILKYLGTGLLEGRGRRWA